MCRALSLGVPPSSSSSSSSMSVVQSTRREVVGSVISRVSGISSSCCLLGGVEKANAEGLAAKLSKRDPAALKNSVFNIPPAAQVYPSFMGGDWEVSLKFSGYLFPSEKVSKQSIVSNVNIPGFQKCSIAAISDVGREETIYKMRIDERTGLEDRSYTMNNSIESHLGSTQQHLVQSVVYDANSNPNRMTIHFDRYRTRNAERIELFFNGRESELVRGGGGGGKEEDDDDPPMIFVCSEYTRQVTLSLSQEFGVARQVVGNYAHFWTWKQQSTTPDILTGNVLTAAYLDPQDPMFFEEPSKPIAIYSHQITAKRLYNNSG